MKLKDFLKQFEGLNENTEVLPQRDGYERYIHNNDRIRYLQNFDISDELESRGNATFKMDILVLSV